MRAEKYDLNHQLIEYSKKEKVLTYKQTNKWTEFLRLDTTPFYRRGLVKHLENIYRASVNNRGHLYSIWKHLRLS